MSDSMRRAMAAFVTVILSGTVIIGLLGTSAAATSPAGQESATQLKKDLREALRDRRTNDAYAALKTLADLDTPRAIDAIVDVGLTSDNYDMEKSIGALLMGIPDGPGFERVCELATKHKDHRVRVVLTLVLGKRSEREAYKAVLTNLLDPFNSIVLTALETIERKNDLGSVPHSIRALELQEQRNKTGTVVWFETRRTLKVLTGKDFPLAVDWNNFWAANGADFKPPTGAPSKEVTSVLQDPPIFFGTEVVTKRVVFVIDVSQSMEKKDPLPEEAGASDKKNGGKTVVPGRKGAPKKPAPPVIPDSRQRLSRVQRELVKVIEQLPKDTRFNIIAFNHEVKPWKDSLQVASDSTKQTAIKFVREFKPYGQTSTDLVLRAAFDVPDVDTIFLLSDGKPRRTEAIPPDPIRKWVRENNRFRRIRVNTVAFEQTAGEFRKFMRRLAKQNFGDYKELR